jgi:hypothetical protein
LSQDMAHRLRTAGAILPRFPRLRHELWYNTLAVIALRH